MNSYLIKAAVALKPIKKFTYLLAIILFANISYQLMFAALPSEMESNELRLNFLALIWIILLNLMIQIYSRMSITIQRRRSSLAKIKDKIHRGFYFLFSFLFIIITMAVIIVSFKILRL
jgi:hypothetical protein